MLALAIGFIADAPMELAPLAGQTSAGQTASRSRLRPGTGAGQGRGTTVSVSIAEGRHPVPSRTRKLSPPAPMVLPWRRGGRVGRRRDSSHESRLRAALGVSAPNSRAVRAGPRVPLGPAMPRAFEPRHGRAGRPQRRQVQLPRDVMDDVRQTSRPAPAQEALSYLERAVDLLSRGDPRQAGKEAQRAKAAAPRSSAVREVLGLAHYEAGDYREALRELQAYRRISGRLDQNHIIADSYRGLGSPEKAVPLAEEALRSRIPPEAKAEAAIVAASALADLGRHDEALALLRRMERRHDVGRQQDLRVWYVTGDVLAKAGRREEAATEFRRIVRHDPTAFDAAER